MQTMPQNGFGRIKSAKFLQTFDNAHAIVRNTMILVAFGFGHMDMDSGIGMF